MHIGQRIKDLREQRKVQQKALAVALGVRQATVSEWESGKSEPTPKRRKKIAQFFGITEAELFSPFQRFDDKSPDLRDDGMVMQKVPVVSWVFANRFGEALDPFPPGASDTFVYTTKKGKNMFSLTVVSDCMTPEFQEGDVLVVSPELHPNNGDFVVVRNENADEATFKQFKKYGTKIVLHPLNPKYQDIELDKQSEYKVVGVVVEKVKKYR